jgi:hypothetical protein
MAIPPVDGNSIPQSGCQFTQKGFFSPSVTLQSKRNKRNLNMRLQ